MSTTDINDQDLEDLMAELEAQNAEFSVDEVPTIAAEVEPVVEAKPVIEENKHWQAEVVVETPKVPADYVATDDEPFDESDFEALAALDATLDPTPADKFDAEQQVGLEEAFVPAEPVDVVAHVLAPVEMKPTEEVAPEPIEEVQPEATPEPEIEQIEEMPAQPLKQELTPNPKPENAKPRSPKSVKQAMELRFKPDVVAFQRETKVTDATLDQCISDQASLMAYQTAQHAQAEAQLSRVKQSFSILEAGLYDAYRKKFLEMGEKATEKAIENAVRLDVQWGESHLLLIEAQTYADMHKGFVMSLRDRKDMLVQRSVDRREEMKGQVRTMNNLNPESPVQQQAKADQGNMASRAMELARASMARA